MGDESRGRLTSWEKDEEESMDFTALGKLLQNYQKLLEISSPEDLEGIRINKVSELLEIQQIMEAKEEWEKEEEEAEAVEEYKPVAPPRKKSSGHVNNLPTAVSFTQQKKQQMMNHAGNRESRQDIKNIMRSHHKLHLLKVLVSYQRPSERQSTSALTSLVAQTLKGYIQVVTDANSKKFVAAIDDLLKVVKNANIIVILLSDHTYFEGDDAVLRIASLAKAYAHNVEVVGVLMADHNKDQSTIPFEDIKTSLSKLDKTDLGILSSYGISQEDIFSAGEKFSKLRMITTKEELFNKLDNDIKKYQDSFGSHMFR